MPSDNNDKEKWVKLLSAMRSNYMTTIQSLSAAGSDFENKYNTKKDEYKADTVRAIKNWIESGNRIRDDFRKVFEEGFKNTFYFIPKAFESSFNSGLEEIIKRARKSFNDILGNFTFSWMFKKDK
jgi:hypothetical protein